MKPFRATLMLAATLALAACSVPNPYSSQPAPVRPSTPAPVPKPPSKPLPPVVVMPPVIELPSAPPSPLPDLRSDDLAYLADSLANKLKQSSALGEVQGAVLLNDVGNQAGSPMDTSGLTARLRANLNGKLNFVDSATVSSLRQQLAYQSGRADMASLVRLGKQSGAEYLLSTHLSRSGANLTLQGQLMELASGEVLWSDRVSGR